MYVNSVALLALAVLSLNSKIFLANSQQVFFLTAVLALLCRWSIGNCLTRDSALSAMSAVGIRGAALLTKCFLMVINSNDSDNATALEVTDAPHSAVVVESGRIAYNRRKQVFNLAAWNVRTTNDSVDSCRSERATAIISREHATANIDICALSEVRREGTGNIVERDHTIHWSGGNKKEAGNFEVANRL